MGTDESEVDVAVIGSGFGGAVAALRFAEAGQRVVVLERGDHVSRERFQADLDMLWKPDRAAYGFHDLQARGKPIIPWIGAAVGGGSHVYAGTLKRRDDWDGFPAAVQGADMDRYYARAEDMLDATPYPDREPYRSVRATQLMFRAGKRLAEEHPDLVEGWGPVNLGIAFAPDGAQPGDTFVNKHGATQRYYDPREQSILGGDIDTKNSLDRNYLHVAGTHGAEIRTLCEVDKIEPLADGGGYRVHYARHRPPRGWWQRVRRRWLPWRPSPVTEPASLVARRVVVAAGAVGSSELLLRNRDLHGTLTPSPALSSRYTTNGDFLTFIIPFRGFWPSWLGFVAAVVCAILHIWWGAGLGLAAYYLGLLVSRRPFDPDLGTTNSDNVRFKGPDGQSQGAYIESGRYPLPGGLIVAILLSGLGGRFRPRWYGRIHRVSVVLRWLIPPLGALARSYPIPLLSMGRDQALGTFRLVDGRAVIDYDVAPNRDFYAYLERLGRLVARAARAMWLPHIPYKLLGRMEVPHNQGGVPMGESATDGVVDHAGRVFGHPDLMVLDGSIIPVSVGPNPALTITAVAERAMEVVLAQLAADGRIVADGEPAARSAS